MDISAVETKVDRMTSQNDDVTPVVDDAVEHANELADIADQLHVRGFLLWYNWQRSQ